MKFYHTTKNEESARNIVANGVDSKKSTQQQKGGFFLWTDLQRALKYTGDDYIAGEGTPHVLVFDLDFNTNDFDIDYEVSGKAIAKWAFDNKDLIAQKTGTTIKILTTQGGYPGYPEGRPRWYSPPVAGTDKGKLYLEAPDSQPGMYSKKSETFFAEIEKLGLLDQMEEAVIKSGVPAVKYMSDTRIFPEAVLDAKGQPVNLDAKEQPAPAAITESFFIIDRWKKLAGLLKG